MKNEDNCHSEHMDHKYNFPRAVIPDEPLDAFRDRSTPQNRILGRWSNGNSIQYRPNGYQDSIWKNKLRWERKISLLGVWWHSIHGLHGEKEAQMETKTPILRDPPRPAPFIITLFYFILYHVTNFLLCIIIYFSSLTPSPRISNFMMLIWSYFGLKRVIFVFENNMCIF